MRSPHLLPAARAERGGHHAPLQSLHLRGVFDAKFCRLAELRVTKRLASRVERATHLRLRHANCCPPRRQSRVLFLEAAARVGLQIINSRTRVQITPITFNCAIMHGTSSPACKTISREMCIPLSCVPEKERVGTHTRARVGAALEASRAPSSRERWASRAADSPAIPSRQISAARDCWTRCSMIRARS